MIENLIEMSRDHELMAVFFFVFLRAIAVIIPPFLGIAVDVTGIAIFGWILGFIYAEVGIIIGASCSFGLARLGRNYLTSRIRIPAKIILWSERLTRKDSFSSWITLRLVTNPAFDVINYAAGFTQIRFVPYIVATFIGNIPSMLIFYYFAGKCVELGDLKLIIMVVSIVLAFFYIVYILFNSRRL